MRNQIRILATALVSIGLLPFLAVDACFEIQAAEIERLTKDGRLKRDPVFVNKGKDLVFVVQEKADQLRIVKLNLASNELKPLHENVRNTEFEPAFSPDGRYYAFVQSRGNLSLALVIHDTQNKKQAVVKPGGGFSGMRHPAISPDNKMVLYCYPEGGRQHIYFTDTLAKNRKQLTDSSGINNWPCFSPNGRKVVFGSTRDGNYDIYVMNADGSQVDRLTNDPHQDIRPVYSPDGKQIAFTSTRDGNYDIFVMNADGSKVRRVTNNPERDDYPAWHPDGRRLLVVSEKKGRSDLYLYPVP